MSPTSAHLFRTLSVGLLLLCFGLPVARADFDASTEGEPQEYTKNWTPTGTGLKLVTTEHGTVSYTLYMLNRYLNQLPAGQEYTDHNGVVHDVNPRNDIFAPQRVLLSFLGWLMTPKFNYTVTIWTVNAFDKVAVIGDIFYKFNEKAEFHTGTGGMPGSRSMLGSHPYWMGNDRVMADEFFRPGFTFGAWLLGEILPRFWYRVMVGNNISTLGTNATVNTRPMALGGSVWWMPTTGEFGPKGAYGDFEEHEKLATRIGLSGTHARESKYTQVENGTPGSTQIRLADSLLLFGVGSLAPGVQVNDAAFNLVATDWAFKYKGFYGQAEFYSRWLNFFHADEPLPVSMINDKGFYVQFAKMIVPKSWEVYTATSWVYGDSARGFGNSHDWLIGLNWYMWKNRNIRTNLQFIEVTHSPTSSSFGYYIGGQSGQIISLAWSILI